MSPGFVMLLETGDGAYSLLLEAGSGALLLEDTPPALLLQNYQFVQVGDGMSTTEKIR